MHQLQTAFHDKIYFKIIKYAGRYVIITIWVTEVFFIRAPAGGQNHVKWTSNSARESSIKKEVNKNYLHRTMNTNYSHGSWKISMNVTFDYI